VKEDNMSEYLYLYRGGQAMPGTASPEQMQKQMAKWMNWLKDLGDRGHVKDPGHPLGSSGKIVKGPRAVTDGPFTEAKDLVGGFTIVKARDIDEAAALTSGCPIFEAGGFVEVRPVQQM
jgi:hypothetical protein